MYNEINKYAANLIVRNGAVHNHSNNLITSNKNTSIAGKTALNNEFCENRILNSLPEDDQSRLIPYLQSVNFAAGDCINQPVTGEKYVYFPLSAVFSQINFLEDGRTAETLMIGSEGLIGVSGVLNPHKSSAIWVQNVIGGSTLRLNSTIFRQEFARGGFLQSIFFEYLNLYVQQISQKTVCNQHHLIEERFCTWLLMIDDRRGNNKLILTHEQIAQFLGVHRPSVTCVAQSLRDRKIIKYSRGNLTILNRKGLENSACECYQIHKR